MRARINAAHNAYRHAAELTPARRVEAAESEPIDVAWTWASEGAGETFEVRGRHLVAIGGAGIVLLAGALCGMWLQLG